MNRIFKVIISLAGLFCLAACSESPLQHALSADPNKFAEAINSNIDNFSYLVPAKDCIQLNYSQNYYSSILKNNPYVKSNKDIDNQCNEMFSKLAINLNNNSEYKGFIYTDFKNKDLWERYYQSSSAKYRVQ